MPRGRTPRPTAIQVGLRGDPGKRRRNHTEPEAPQTRPVCPDYLGTIAQAEWESICDQLETIGVLSAVDSKMIELYARTYELYREADQQLKEETEGGVVLSNNTQTPMLSPYYSTRNKYLEQLVKMLDNFGLSPVSRAKMRIKQETIKPNKMANILKVIGA